MCLMIDGEGGKIGTGWLLKYHGASSGFDRKILGVMYERGILLSSQVERKKLWIGL